MVGIPLYYLGMTIARLHAHVSYLLQAGEDTVRATHLVKAVSKYSQGLVAK